MAATHKRLKVMSKENELPPLDSLDAQIRKARGASDPKAAPEAEDGGKSTALRSGTELIAGVAVGGFIGYYADDWLGTRPALTIFGIFLGMAGGVMNIYRAVSSEAAQTDDHHVEKNPGSNRISED